MIVRVEKPFQVAHEGTVHRPNESADVPDHVAAHWLTSGWVVEEVSDDTASQASDSKRPTK